MQGSLLILLILKELNTTRTEYPFKNLAAIYMMDMIIIQRGCNSLSSIQSEPKYRL